METYWEIEEWTTTPYWDGEVARARQHWRHFKVGDKGSDRFADELVALKTLRRMQALEQRVRLVKVTREVVVSGA